MIKPLKRDRLVSCRRAMSETEINTQKIVEMCERLRRNEVRDPDHMANVDKYGLISLLCPQVDAKVIKAAKSNASRLKPGNLMFHLVSLVPRLFLESLFLDAKRDEHGVDWFKSRQLKTRLESVNEELEDLYEEVENLKAGKGYISYKEHALEVEDYRRQVKALQRENDALSQKMREREAFLQEKLSCQSRRHAKAVAELHSVIIKSAESESEDD